MFGHRKFASGGWNVYRMPGGGGEGGGDNDGGSSGDGQSASDAAADAATDAEGGTPGGGLGAGETGIGGPSADAMGSDPSDPGPFGSEPSDSFGGDGGGGGGGGSGDGQSDNAGVRSVLRSVDQTILDSVMRRQGRYVTYSNRTKEEVAAAQQQDLDYIKSYDNPLTTDVEEPSDGSDYSFFGSGELTKREQNRKAEDEEREGRESKVNPFAYAGGMDSLFATQNYSGGFGTLLG